MLFSISYKVGIFRIFPTFIFIGFHTGSSSSLDFEDDGISHPSISSLPTLALQSSIKKLGGKKKKSSSSADSNNNNGVVLDRKKSVSGSSISSERERPEKELTLVGSQTVGQVTNLSTQIGSKRGRKKKKSCPDMDFNACEVDSSKGTLLGEGTRSKMIEPRLTNFSSPFNESSESLVQTALKRLIMLGVGEIKHEDEESRDSSSHSLMMSIDHSSDDPNGSVIDGGTNSNLGAPTSQGSTSSSTSNDPNKSCSSPDSKKKKARTTFTGRQIFELEKQFEIKKYLSSSERTAMAKLLNVTETQVGEISLSPSPSLSLRISVYVNSSVWSNMFCNISRSRFGSRIGEPSGRNRKE